MTQVSTRAAEAYEQKIVAAVSTVKPLNENVYSVPSSREGVKPQIITTDENGVANFCTCESFEFNGWERYGHKCYHAQATERYIEAQKAVKVAEQIVAKPQTDVERYIAQGVDRNTAERIVNAQGIKSHGNAKAYEPRGFSLYK
jgi:hypothetical protein